MSGAGREALAEFVAELRRLRELAGSPSLNRLVRLTAELGRPLARSTISDKLAAKSFPEWDFVVSFVKACQVYAERSGGSLSVDRVDLAGWDAAHLRLLRALDVASAGQRLAAAVQADLGRRASQPGPATTADRTRVVPRQLPAPVRHFVGRVAELAVLTGLADEVAEVAGTVVISAIDGTAGVGKTAVAVHWAHQVAWRFPDGQLYVNLRGFDPTGRTMSPAEAVRGFLDAFVVPAGQIPVSLEAQAALYRSLLAGRQVLVVLDNARDIEQVRPLLPGSPGCLVVVTSRSRLAGLIAAEGAHPLTLDLLSPAESRALLARRLGPERVAAEESAVDEIITRCARLPLALAVVAARSRAHPEFPLAVLAGELRTASGALHAFDGGDSGTDVRLVFSWSYHQLDGEAARLFRLLGSHPGADLAVPAAASLSGLPPREVRGPLARLARAHLITEHAPGRYTFHDLLRAYATELARATDPAAERHAAQHRILDHYLHTANAAALLFNPHRDPITLTAGQPGVGPQPLTDDQQALAWFIAEHRVLLAAIDQAVAAGFDTHAWQLAWTLADFFQRRGHWHDWAATQRAGLEAARRHADRIGSAHAHHSVARAYLQLGRDNDAHHHFRRALHYFAELDDRAGQALTHRGLSYAYERQGRNQEALEHARQALDLYQAAGHRAGQANALNAIGWYCAQVGDHQQALSYCEEALTMHREVGDHRGEAATWDSLGYAHHHLGNAQQAIVCYQRAVHAERILGDRYNEADVLSRLGDSLQAGGEPLAARTAWQQALAILDELGHTDSAHLYAKLRRN
jgi:tetratricopeptide (TPR) repeat protein